MVSSLNAGHFWPLFEGLVRTVRSRAILPEVASQVAHVPQALTSQSAWHSASSLNAGHFLPLFEGLVRTVRSRALVSEVASQEAHAPQAPTSQSPSLPKEHWSIAEAKHAYNHAWPYCKAASGAIAGILSGIGECSFKHRWAGRRECHACPCHTTPHNTCQRY